MALRVGLNNPPSKLVTENKAPRSTAGCRIQPGSRWSHATYTTASPAHSHVTSPARLNFRDPTSLSGKSTKDLVLAHLMLKACSIPFVTNTGPKILEHAEKFGLAGPIYWGMEKSFYKHFVAGPTLEASMKVVDKLAALNVKSALDYSVESADKIEHFIDVLLKSMEAAAKRPRDLKFGVYKTTALVNHSLLERMSQLLKWKETHPDFDLPWFGLGEVPIRQWPEFVSEIKPGPVGPSDAPPQLNQKELDELKTLLTRVERIANRADQLNVPLLIDAEQTWFQPAIRFLAMGLKQQYNRERPIILNTYQMYLKDTMAELKEDMAICKRKNLHFGAKLVRGAYMVGEAERCKLNNKPYPVHDTKEATDLAYNTAVAEVLDVVKQDKAALVIASHNEETMLKGAEGLDARGIARDSPNVYFAQLYGMMDHATLALAREGYNVLKYVPFGPIRDVMPYLIRRLQENNGFLARTHEERNLIKAELKRRGALLW